MCHHLAPAAYPPAMGEQPLNAGILGLATHKACGIPCRHRTRWSLTPPFHPYRILLMRVCGGRFLSRCSAVTGSFPLRSMVLFVARTFLSSFMDKMSDRPSGHTCRLFQPRIMPLWELRMKFIMMSRSADGSTSSSTRVTASVTLRPEA